MSQFTEILSSKLSFVKSCQQEKKWTFSAVMVERVVSKSLRRGFQSTEKFLWEK